MISKPNRYFHHFHKIVGAEILYYQIEKPRVPCKRKEPDGPTYSSNGAFRDFFFFCLQDMRLQVWYSIISLKIIKYIGGVC